MCIHRYAILLLVLLCPSPTTYPRATFPPTRSCFYLDICLGCIRNPHIPKGLLFHAQFLTLIVSCYMASALDFENPAPTQNISIYARIGSANVPPDAPTTLARTSTSHNPSSALVAPPTMLALSCGHAANRISAGLSTRALPHPDNSPISYSQDL